MTRAIFLALAVLLAGCAPGPGEFAVRHNYSRPGGRLRVLLHLGRSQLWWCRSLRWARWGGGYHRAPQCQLPALHDGSRLPTRPILTLPLVTPQDGLPPPLSP